MNRKTTLLILIVCMLGLSLDMFSQATDCKSAPTALPGTNIAAQGIQQFYKYTPLQDEVVTLSSCSAPVNYTITVKIDSCDGAVVDTFMTACSTGTKKQVSFVASAGRPYFISWTSTGSGTSYPWNLSNAAITSGSGIDCETAIVAVLGTGNLYNSTSALPIWYKYTATKDARIEISTEGYEYPAKIKVFGSCNPQDTIEYSLTNVVGSEINHDLVYFYVKANQTFYFRWNNPNSGANISFPFELEEGTLSAGETCSTALSLAGGNNAVSQRYPTWFFDSETSITKISVTSTNYGYEQVRKSCGINDFDKSVKHLSNGIQFETQVGTTYYVKVYPKYLQATVSASFSTPAAGESCDHAITAVVGINSADHSNNTDQWYIYTPTHSGTVSLSSTNAYWGQVQVRFYKDCNQNPVTIGYNSIEVAANTPLYICLRVSPFASPTYNWTLNFTQETEGNSFTSAIPVVPGTINGGGATNIWYKYTPAANSTVTVSTCGTNSSGTYVEVENADQIFLGSNDVDPECTGHSTYSFLVEGGTTIYMNWKSSNGINNWTLASTPTGVSVPQGYSCSHPVVISATGIQGPTTYQANQMLVWYKFVVPSDGAGLYTFSNCVNSPSYPTRVYVLTDCEINGENTLATGTVCGTNGSAASVSLAANQTVYIVWSQLDYASGTLNWTLNFTPSTTPLPLGYTCDNANTITTPGQKTANTITGDEFFTYTPDKSGHLQISTVGLSTPKVMVSLYESCDDYSTVDPETNKNNPLKQKELISDSLGLDCVAGNTYHIVWSKGYTSDNFAWNLAYSPVSSSAEISSFAITGQETSTIISSTNSNAGTISFQMPYNTSLTSLTPIFSASAGSIVRVNSSVQTSGTTSNSFANAVVYAVTAQDEITTKNWTVTVTDAPNHGADIASFSLKGVAGVINNTTRNITVTLPYGTDVTDLIPVLTLSAQATIDSTGKHNFTNVVSYVVTAGDGTTTKNWTVQVLYSSNTVADITSYTLKGVAGVINHTTRNITVTLPYGTDVTDLIPVLTLSAQATIDSTGKHDFTNAVSYVVTAGNGTTTKNWTVQVSLASNTDADITSYTLKGVAGVINQPTGNITVTLPYGTDVTELVPVLTLSAQATIDSTGKHDFTNAVSYVVTAGNGTTTKNWTVQVLLASNTVADITSYTLKGVAGVINQPTGNIAFTFPYGTDVTDLVPALTLSDQATIDSTGKHDFTNAVSYVVTAGNGTTTKNWTVTVTLTAANTETAILSFTVPNQVGDSKINAGDKTVAIVVPSGTDLTTLVATFTLSSGATAKVGTAAQTSGTTVNDFTSTVTYVITAEDNSTTSNWLVTISLNTAVSTSVADNIKIYPVPAVDVVNINIPEGSQGEWTIQLINTNGQLVYSSKKTLNEGISPIDVSNCVTGVYTLILTKDNQTIVKKLVIKK